MTKGEATEGFDAYGFIQAKRAGRNIKRPRTIRSSTDSRGWITICNESGRPCINDAEAQRVILIADLRRGHPRLKPGVLGRTIPNTSDYYRYVAVQFDNKVTEVVSISAIQPIHEEVAEASVALVRAEVKGTSFDWDARIAGKKARELESKAFRGSLDISNIRRGGAGPHELYAYTFPSLMELACAQGKELFPVKIGYSGVARELFPSLSRISSQLGDTAGRCELAVVLLVWKSWNGRALEFHIHSHLRTLGRTVESAVGREWFYTNGEELLGLLKQVQVAERSGLPLNGPVPRTFAGFAAPSTQFAEHIQVLCSRLNQSGQAMIGCVDFDDLLEEAATTSVRESRSVQRDNV